MRDGNDEVNYPFGWKGGANYYRETTEPGEDQADEQRMRQKYFAHAFGEIPCLLLPHPGNPVKCDSHCEFGGKLIVRKTCFPIFF